MANNSGASAFEQALDDFKMDLKEKERRNFCATTLSDLTKEIEKLQASQHAGRRGKNAARLKPFLEAMDQLGKVIEVFTNTSEMVAFVWVRPLHIDMT